MNCKSQITQQLFPKIFDGKFLFFRACKMIQFFEYYIQSTLNHPSLEVRNYDSKNLNYFTSVENFYFSTRNKEA